MKISPKQYFHFCEDYYKGTFPHQRFGQAFFNTFWVQLRVQSDPDLFYQENAAEAQRYIEEKYVAF